MEEGVLVRIAVTKKILWKKAIESKSQVLHLVWVPNICWLTRKCRSHKILYLVSANIGVAQPKGRFPKKKTDILLDFVQTRSYAALRAVDLDWIVRPGYSWGGYILGCSQHLASCLRHSAQIGPDLLCHPSSVICHLSLTHLISKWLEVMIFRHWRGIPTDWKWWFPNWGKGGR